MSSNTTPSNTSPNTNNTQPANVVAARQRIAALEAYARDNFLERDDTIHATLVVLAASEHIVLIGPPGAAKSAVINLISEVIKSMHFEYLLTRFSEPNELFGPIDLNVFKSQGVYRRNIAGMLPEAETAFLDEAFKANSAILNALLTLLNERKFDNGGVRASVPLRTVLMASNELPADSTLGALWDRALVRVQTKYLKEDDNWSRLCFGTGGAMGTMQAPSVTLDDFKTLGEYADTIGFSADAVKGCASVKQKMVDKGWIVSDRRWKKIAGKILRANAALAGATEVGTEHLDILSLCLWEKPEQIPEIEQFVMDVAAAWLKDVRDIGARLDTAFARLADAKAIKGGPRLRALADITELISPIGAEAIALHKQHGRAETEKVMRRAEALTIEVANAARGM